VEEKNWQVELTLRHLATINKHAKKIQLSDRDGYNEWNHFMSICERRGEDLSKVTSGEFNWLKSLAERLKER